MAFWQITYGTETRDAAAWGIGNLRRRRKSAATDLVTFNLAGAAVDSVPPFAWLQPMTILRNGSPWFYGWVTKVPRKASGRAESISYEISGPWYWLEKTVFQQQWYAIDTTGGAEGLITTTQSDVILGQALDGTKMNSGEVIAECLAYAQVAFQGQPWTGNPPDPTKGPIPFQVGALTPAIVVPYSEVRDKTCADLVRLMMKYSPDAVAWCDYTTNPPTLNIDRRANLQAATISVLGGTLATIFNPTPRYDLQVPCVLAKFQNNVSRNGTSYTVNTVQQYPLVDALGAPILPNTPRAWVQTIDLVGGETTSTSVPIMVKARPVHNTDPIAMDWIFYKEPWLKPSATAMNNGAYTYDWANISCAFLSTVLDANDPLAASPPPAPPLPFLPSGDTDCHTLVAELITGNVADWMFTTDGVLAAKVLITVWLAYSGTDPATMDLFTYDPKNPGNPTKPGAGFLVRYYNCKVTNAESKTYTELTSWSASEPVPPGFAQYLYECLAPLHFEGELTTVEPECSDPLPIGSIFNTSDGLPDWQAMNALVVGVEEDIDRGATTVRFGPPLFLGLQELEELFRANLGRLPSYKLNQRTTGKTTAGANVQNPKHSADTNTVHAVVPSVRSAPWSTTVNVDAASGAWTAYVNPHSYLMQSPVRGDIVTISSGLNSPLSLNSAGDFIYLECTVSSLAPGTATVNSGSAGGTFDPTKPAWDPGGQGYLANDGATPPNQTFFRVLLSTIAPDSKGNPVITPCCLNHLLIFNVADTGEAAINAFPASTASGS